MQVFAPFLYLVIQVVVIYTPNINQYVFLPIFHFTNLLSVVYKDKDPALRLSCQLLTDRFSFYFEGCESEAMFLR